MRQIASAGVLLVLCLLGCAPLAPAATPAPAPFTAEYEISRNGIAVARTRITLELSPTGRYLYRAHTEPNALMSLWREDRVLEESSGQFVDDRPRPDRYVYQRATSGHSHRVDMRFDWAQDRLRIGKPPNHWTLDIGAGVLDKLVQQLALGLELKQGTEAPSFRVADGGKLKDYRYRRIGRETLVTPIGQLQALKLERRKDEAASDYTLWLAPDLDYLPLRIVRRHRGVLYRMDIDTLERPTAGSDDDTATAAQDRGSVTPR